MPNCLKKSSHGLAFTDRLDVHRAVAGAAFHDGIQRKLALQSVIEGRLHGLGDGHGVGEVGGLVAEGVFIADGALPMATDAFIGVRLGI